MKYIEENNVFTEEIMLLELDTPVKGYDGTDIGPANEQAQALANRTLWLKNKLDDLSSNINPDPDPNPNPTPSELTIVDVESKGTNVKFVYPTPTDYNFNHYALVFKDVEASDKRTETVDYTTDLPDINKSEFPVSDERGYFTYGESTSHQLAKIDNSANVEQYQTEELKSYLEDGILVQLKVKQSTNSIIPVTASNKVGEFNLVSSTIYSGFEPWKAFQAPLTESESVKVENYGYWSDIQIWQNRNNEVWLGVTSDTAFEISGYSFQSFEALYWTSTSTPITAWELQGRNSDSDSWVSLDTQTNQVIMKKGNDWNTYLLKESVSYKQYRILVTDVSLKSARASIPRLRFLTEPKVLIKDVNNNYFTINNDELTLLESVTSDTFAESGFRHHDKPIKISDLEAYLPVKIVSVNEGVIETQLFTNTNQIVTHIPLPNTSTWEGLLSIVATKFKEDSDKDNIKVGFSVDGKTCLIFKEGTWAALGDISLTSEYAKSLVNEGLSLEDMSKITVSEWETLLENSIGANTVFGIVYAKSILNKNESLTPSEVQISFDEVRYWQQMSLEQVKIIITKDFITFRPLEKGKYKFCYRFN